MLNHRWPVLIGEAGSGKSHQANAAALELTGLPPTEIECEATTGELQLIKDTEIDPETKGSYDDYGPLMQAFTGYDDARQQEPAVSTGRIARFDESGRLGPKAYTIVKKARQKKPGDDFYGRPMLPGASAIWTSNPVGPRYPDRHAPDPAMRRELAEIDVGYPDMSSASPELYEFALIALFDENNHINAPQAELAPTYEKRNIPLDQREILTSGGIIVAKDEIIENIADQRHGSLWRFCGAIKSLQESFVCGNVQVETYPETLLRFKEDADGVISIATDGGGEPLTLSNSTVTLGELASWMQGFNDRRQKKDPAFHVDTLTDWLNFKITTYLKQADKADKAKLRAIFSHFGFLDAGTHAVPGSTKPLTPKEIGYLSPRVPRPVHIEYPTPPNPDDNKKAPSKPEVAEPQTYETEDVILENQERVLLGVGMFFLEEGTFDSASDAFKPLAVSPGAKFRIGNEAFVFAGVVQDERNVSNGLPVGRHINESLYRIVSPEQLQRGILSEYEHIAVNDLADLEQDVEEYLENERER